MEYSPDFLSRVAELASQLTPIRDMAVLLDVEEDALRLAVAESSDPVSMAYRKAKAATALELRRQEIGLAKLGSPLAVQLTAGYLRDMTADEDS